MSQHDNISVGRLPDKISHRSLKASPPGLILSRRSLLRQIGVAGVSLAAMPAFADELIKLPLPSDPRERPLTHDFPQKPT